MFSSSLASGKNASPSQRRRSRSPSRRRRATSRSFRVKTRPSSILRKAPAPAENYGHRHLLHGARRASRSDRFSILAKLPGNGTAARTFEVTIAE